MIRRNIFLLSAAIVLAGCASMAEPTVEATRVDRIVLAQNSQFGFKCRMAAPTFNPELSLEEISDRCGCFDKHMIDNLDGRIAAWAVQFNDWADRPVPAWVDRRQDIAALGRAGFSACNLKTGP